MVYTKQTWVNGSDDYPLSASRMGHLEDGIGVVDTGLTSHKNDLVNPHQVTQAQVGLSNVDNTSDATKNAAAATLTNKTLTAPVINSPTGIVKADVGLSSVDNTSDAAKNSATASLTNKTINGSSNTITNVAQAAVTNLSSDLALKASLNIFNLALASTPDVLVSGVITRDSNGAATSFNAIWPDSATGTYVGTPSGTFLGAIDSYVLTHILSGVTITYTQPTVTRNASGAVTTRPTIVVS